MKELKCTSCGAPIDWDGQYGKPVECPFCGSRFLPSPTEVDDVWLMTDRVAFAEYEFDGKLEQLEHDIRFEVKRGGPWQPVELEYKREIRRLLREGALADKGTYWWAKPASHRLPCQAKRNAEGGGPHPSFPPG